MLVMVTLSRGSRATYGLYRIWASCPVTLRDFLAALLRSHLRVIRRPPKLQLGSLHPFPLSEKRNESPHKKHREKKRNTNDIKMETKCILNENDIVEAWKRNKKLAING